MPREPLPIRFRLDGRLLYDHLGRLQNLACQGGWDLAFEGLDAAAAQLDPHAPVE